MIGRASQYGKMMLSITKICVLCQLKHNNQHAVCNACIALLPQLGITCQQCANPLLQAGLCGECIKHPPLIDSISIRYPFTEPLRGLIHDFKYQAGLYLISLFAQLMIPNELSDFEVLIPVPIHPKRLRERGFNQSGLLAKSLSQQLHIPYDIRICKKITDSASQTNLSALERKKDLSHHYEVRPHHYQRVVIIDDVYTTGSTIQALTRCLKNAGAVRVEAWCIARAL